MPNCFQFDLADIEARLAALNPNVFVIGHDIHTRKAAELFNCSPEDVTEGQRRFARCVNFVSNYGLSYNTITPKE